MFVTSISSETWEAEEHLLLEWAGWSDDFSHQCESFLVPEIQGNYIPPRNKKGLSFMRVYPQRMNSPLLSTEPTHWSKGVRAPASLG